MVSHPHIYYLFDALSVHESKLHPPTMTTVDGVHDEGVS